MNETTKVFAGLGTLLIVKLPSMSVIVPTVVPLTKTDAPTTGKPSSSEVTVPVTFETCAFTRPIPIIRKVIKSINFLFIRFSLKV